MKLVTADQNGVLLGDELYRELTESLEALLATTAASIRQARRAYSGRPVPATTYEPYRDVMIAIARLQNVFAPSETAIDARITVILAESDADFLHRLRPAPSKASVPVLDGEQHGNLTDACRRVARAVQDAQVVLDDFYAPDQPDDSGRVLIDALGNVLYAITTLSNRLNLPTFSK